MQRTVTLVQSDGTPVSEMDIWDAHRSPGSLHRAFSVFVFSPDRRRLMIQKRFTGKPTFGGQWSNTCCSHQFAGEGDTDAGERRLREELGFSVRLTQGPAFVYQAEDPRKNGMCEHEHDTIVIGTSNENVTVIMNPKEVEDWKWIGVEELRADIASNPGKYVPWLPIALSHLPA